MNLYIKLENGQPINLPMLEDNILQCYPGIDLTNTDLFAPFIRLPQPSIYDLPRTKLQILDTNFILAEDGVSYTDSYFIRDMDETEISYATDNERKNIDFSIQSFIDTASKELSDATDQDKSVWQTFIDTLNAFEYTDPFTVSLPSFPKKLQDGTWSTTNSNGTAPNVIE